MFQNRSQDFEFEVDLLLPRTRNIFPGLFPAKKDLKLGKERKCFRINSSLLTNDQRNEKACLITYEPLREKNCLRGFRPGPT